MKKLDKDYENLSAFLDDELSDYEKQIFEDKLKSSSLLRNKLLEFKKIQKRIHSIKPLPVDEYFVSRLSEKIKSQTNKSFIVKLFNKPIVVFSIITIAAMVFFKFNPNFFENFISIQKENIVDFYTENLKPFILNSELSSEDIFSFAFNRTLPIDRNNNQVLKLGIDNGGKEYFEVKYTANVSQTFNLKSFVKALNLDAQQSKQIDSILKSYKDDLLMQVLVNDKNAIALNSNIWNYQNAIRTDLIKYAANTNLNVIKKMLPDDYSIPEVNDFKVAIKTGRNSHKDLYFIVTPDTIFSRNLSIERQKISDELMALKEEMKKTKKVNDALNKVNFDLKVYNNDPSIAKDINVFITENEIKVHIPEVCSPEKFLPNYEILNDELDKAVNKFKDMTFSVNYDYNFNGNERKVYIKNKSNSLDSSASFKVKYKLPNLRNKKQNLRNEHFDFYFGEDTLSLNLPREYSKELNRFKKEMELLREEIELLNKGLKKEPQKGNPKKKLIEI